MEITKYRRMFQMSFNRKHNITPRTIVKSVSQKEGTIKGIKHMAKSDVQKLIIKLDAEMREAAEKFEFEKAIQLRDQIEEIQRSLVQEISDYRKNRKTLERKS
jgi:excinuclease ABC subunit B